MTEELHVVGGGMAGCEAAWQAERLGVPVVLHEMRPDVGTFAHKTDLLAELVCSNSFRSDDDAHNAVGQLHWEMRQADGLIMSAADANRLPAGGALAVDREGFARTVTERVESRPGIRVSRDEVRELPDRGNWIFATGPLTSPALGDSIRQVTGADSLAFFDAIAPIVHFDSIDMSRAWMQSRYDKGETEEERAAYINCPLDAAQYEALVDALLAAEKTEFHEGETATYFEGCLPVEVMAERGRETLRFGPMKPVGLTNPHAGGGTGAKPHAVVQLRRDNALGTLYNMVGFQTKMKHGAQTEVFRMIPGLENARFARLGGIHRNTFLNSPTLLDDGLRLKSRPGIRFAGQVTGVEGYVESAASGLVAGRTAALEILASAGSGGSAGDRARQAPFEPPSPSPCPPPPPPTTACGALVAHVSGGAESATFQPMNVNFGLFPPICDASGKGAPRGRRNRKERYLALTDRAKADWRDWLARTGVDGG